MSNKIIVYQSKNDVQLYGSIKELMTHEKPKRDKKLLSKWQIYRAFNKARANGDALEFDKGKIFERNIKRSKHEN